VTNYLVDTNVISASAPSVIASPAELVAWMEAQSPNLFLSVVTIAEVTEGIAKAKRKGARRKASDLSAWLQTLLHLYGERVLPLDTSTAEIAGTLADLARGRGHSPGFADVVIAATARRHDLTVLSRNERHFAPLDIAVVDPFRKLPSN
jgi:predicted nucleic acid-binding protein